MEDLSNSRTQDHLIGQILNRNANVPNYALLVGAGASKSSNVGTGSEMITRWRRELYRRSRTKDSIDDWLKGQYWYNDEDEYPILFETMYDEPVQRRNFIEECLKDARPNWGYVYLASLLSERYFNVVFTTNFDDLVNEACFLYSEGLRPVVAAHDSAVTSIRLTQERAKIIKLHGDFLYDNIKNTVRELESLEANTQKKFTQFAQEYGLVVIGYGGRDRSVLDTLEVLLRSDEYFLPGVYWCTTGVDTLSKRVRSLLRRDRVYLVEIDGFDEFMAELHSAAGLKLPAPIIRPFQVAEERARLFVNVQPILAEHPIISSHISEVLEEVNRFSELEETADLVPGVLMAEIRRARGDTDGAIGFLQKEYKNNPNDGRIVFSLAEMLSDAERRDELQDLARQASALDPADRTYFLLLVEDNEGVLGAASTGLSDERLESERPKIFLIAKVNRAIALKRLDRSGESQEELSSIPEEISPVRTGQWNIAAGVAALRNDKPNMLKYVRRALLGRQITVDQARRFPVFEDYRCDEDFRDLLRDWNGESLSTP